MLHSLASQLGLIALAAVTLLVFWKGGAAERYGGLLVAVVWTTSVAGQVLSGGAIPETLLLIMDLIAATGFLVLAIRYASMWLGAAMMFQAGIFTLHLLHWSGDLQLDREYMLSVNLVSYCVLACLGGGAAACWIKSASVERRRRAAEGSNSTIDLAAATRP